MKALNPHQTEEKGDSEGKRTVKLYTEILWEMSCQEYSLKIQTARSCILPCKCPRRFFYSQVKKHCMKSNHNTVLKLDTWVIYMDICSWRLTPSGVNWLLQGEQSKRFPLKTELTPLQNVMICSFINIDILSDLCGHTILYKNI